LIFFFVISGFLISSIIIGGMYKESFSFKEFYARRIKRIFPALILVMVVCYVFGWFALLPDEYKQLGKHIAAGAGFVSNLFFWQEAGYFDSASETKPMLHLWSLGIEEQFYIVWPLLVYLTWKRRFSLLIFTICIIAISFVINISIVHSDVAQAFYSPITRLWELMIGSVLGYIRLHKISLLDRAKQRIYVALDKVIALNGDVLRDSQSVLGALLIIVAVLFVTRDKAFPGWWALLPTLGAFLIISAGSQAWFNRVVLSHRLLVWFGLISYPLYLWHWPLLAFTRIIESGTPTRIIRIEAIFISVALAWLTYKLIEKPIRFGSYNIVNGFMLCVLMSTIGCVGFNAYKQDGFPFRSSLENVKLKIGDLTWERSKFDYYINCPSELASKEPSLNFCLLSANSPPHIAIFGDSHAEDKFPGFANIDKKNTWLLIGNDSCPPVSGINVAAPVSEQNCQRKMEKALEYIVNTPSIHTVVLSFFGSYMLNSSFSADHKRMKSGPQDVKITSEEFFSKNKIELFYLGLEKTVINIEMHNKQVVVIIDVPELPFMPRDCIERPFTLERNNHCKLSAATAHDRQKVLREVLFKLAEAHPRMRVYDSLNLLCDKENCSFETDDMLIYRDSHHLSFRGSNVFSNDFIRWMSQN